MKGSVQLKINMVLVLSITVILMAFGVYDYFATSRRLTNELNRAADVMAERLADRMALPLWNVDNKRAAEVVIEEMGDKRFYAISVKETDGKAPFIQRQRNEKWEISDSKGEITPALYVHRQKEIVKGGFHLHSKCVPCGGEKCTKRRSGQCPGQIGQGDVRAGASVHGKTECFHEEINRLFNEIAAASNEQARDIQAVNRAWNEIEKAMYLGVSKAKQSLGVSQAMRDRSTEMKQIVDDLIKLIGDRKI